MVAWGEWPRWIFGYKNLWLREIRRLRPMDGDSLRAQIATLEKTVEDLRGRISELEAERESQGIIIEALIGQVKMARDADEESLPGKKFRASIVGLETRKSPTVEEDESGSSGRAALVQVAQTDIPPEGTETMALTKQIKDIFHSKSKTIDLKINYTFRRFI